MHVLDLALKNCRDDLKLWMISSSQKDLPPKSNQEMSCWSWAWVLVSQRLLHSFFLVVVLPVSQPKAWNILQGPFNFYISHPCEELCSVSLIPLLLLNWQMPSEGTRHQIPDSFLGGSLLCRILHSQVLSDFAAVMYVHTDISKYFVHVF